MCILFVLFPIFREKFKFLHYCLVVDGDVLVQMSAPTGDGFHGALEEGELMHLLARYSWLFLHLRKRTREV